MKILICLMFKNSVQWLERFMLCVQSLISKSENIEYALSIIHGDSVDGTDEYLKSLLSNLKASYQLEITKIPVNYLPKRLDGIQRLVLLRNMFLYPPTIKKYDYLLVIDTDVIFTPQTILGMVKDIKHDTGVIAPMIYIDNFRRDGAKVFYDTFAYRINNKHFTNKVPYIPSVNVNGDKVIEVDSVGSIYIIRTDIFTDYNITYRTYERKNIKEHSNRVYESEQVVLCNDIREKTPYKIHLDLNTKAHHINLPDYGLAWH